MSIFLFSERLLSAGKEESEWQTIGFVSNSNCDHSEPEAVFKKPVATPMPKGRTGKTYHNKRWSHNRKVNVENGSVNGRSALTKSTRALRSIHEDVLNKQNSGIIYWYLCYQPLIFLVYNIPWRKFMAFFFNLDDQMFESMSLLSIPSIYDVHIL